MSAKNKKKIDEFFETKENRVKFAFNGKTFNASKLYVYYCYRDVVTLRAGFRKFRKAFKAIEGGVDIKDYYSISAAALAIVRNAGCLDDASKAQLTIRTFVGRAVRGGRIAVTKGFLRKRLGLKNEKLINKLRKGKPVKLSEEEKKEILESRIADFDATSLYPAAIVRMCEDGYGIPRGLPKEAKKKQELLTSDYSIATIRITKVGRKIKTPFISYKRKNGRVEWTNDPPPVPITVGKIMLEDLIKFQEIEWEMVQGLVWNDGFNTKIGPLMRYLFNERKKHKKAMEEAKDQNVASGHNALQFVFKQAMNSCYGKLVTKLERTKKQYIAHRRWVKKYIPLDSDGFDNPNTKLVKEEVWDVRKLEKICRLKQLDPNLKRVCRTTLKKVKKSEEKNRMRVAY